MTIKTNNKMEMGGKGGVVLVYRNIKTFFCSQNSRNSDRSEGLQLQPSFLYKYDLYVTSA